MATNAFQAVVIGGGPGGSSAATFLALKGIRTLVLEKEFFPRFHIGESLLPYNRRIFAEMGVLPQLEAHGFPIKYGAQFSLGNSSKTLKLTFGKGRFTRESTAFQVERAVFDDILLKHAERCGAEVRHGWTVTAVGRTGDRMSVEANGPQGDSCRFDTAYVIDASGRSNLTGNQEQLKVVHPKLKKVAIFGHFEGVVLEDGERRSDTVIVRLADKWFWIIPISSAKTSVGCVLDRSELGGQTSPAELFEQLWRSSSAMRLRLQPARLLEPLQTTADFSYYNNCLARPGLLRVGDAAGFMDPIFSAGVYLAMHSGKRAAQVVQRVILNGQREHSLLRKYEQEIFRAMRLYWEMVEGFYTTPFVELFMEPRPKFNLPDAITALLAGELEGGFGAAWRRRLFFLLTRLQKHWPLVPRITFDETGR